MTQGETLEELEENIKDAYLLMVFDEIEPLLAKSERPYQEIISKIRKRQHDRGHQPSVKEEVDMYLHSEL